MSARKISPERAALFLIEASCPSDFADKTAWGNWCIKVARTALNGDVSMLRELGQLVPKQYLIDSMQSFLAEKSKAPPEINQKIVSLFGPRLSSATVPT